MGVSVWRAARRGVVACLVLLLFGCRPSIGLSSAPTPTTTSAPALSPEPVESTITPEAATVTEIPATTAPSPEPASPEPASPEVATAECTVSARSLRLRSGPSTDTAVLAGLVNGQLLTASGRNPEGTWLAIRTPEGVDGWVSAEFVTCTQPVDTLPVATTAPAP